MSEVIFNSDEVLKFDEGSIRDLKARALDHPEGHVRLCMHRDLADPVHEMVIVHRRGVYVRPHKHVDKSESFHIIEGSLLVVIFDDGGNLVDRIEMGGKGVGRCCICRMEKGIWHSVIPTSEVVVFHEITKGPFTGKGDSIYPNWAPEPSESARIESFMSQILGMEIGVDV